MESFNRDEESFVAVDHVLVDDAASLSRLCEAVSAASRVAVDTETEVVPRDELGRLVPGPCRVVSAALFVDGETLSFVVDRAALLADDDLYDRFASVFADVVVDAWNAEFDSKVFDQSGLQVGGWRDQMLSDKIIRSGSAFSSVNRTLAAVTLELFGFELEKTSVRTSYSMSSGPLSSDEVIYAGRDSVATLWIGDSFEFAADAVGLTNTIKLEHAAQPFVLWMQQSGLFLDADAWHERLAEFQSGLDDVLTQLADLTGGGQATLFSSAVEPSWDPASSKQTMSALNTYCEAAVREFTGGRLLSAASGDGVGADTLAKLVDPETGEQPEIVSLILKFRDWSKKLTTYGDAFIKKNQYTDGRVRSTYNQAGTDTGRLSSSGPNAQNLTPDMKPFFKPTPDGTKRVFIDADYGQQELRILADESGDENMLHIFSSGQDLHTATASSMLGVDMEELEKSDPKLFKKFRQQAKVLNFGVVYGQRGRAMSDNLTYNYGVPTTYDEALKLLSNYTDVAYPGVGVWLSARDDYISELASKMKDPTEVRVDWESTLRLYDRSRQMSVAAKAYVDAHNKSVDAAFSSSALEDDEEVTKARLRTPGHVSLAWIYRCGFTVEEFAARVADANPGLAASGVDVEEEVRWASSFHFPVVLLDSGDVLSFETRTRIGRRRIFEFNTGSLVLEVAKKMVRSDKPNGRFFREQFAKENPSAPNLVADDGSVLSRSSVDSLFKGDKGPILAREMVEWLVRSPELSPVAYTMFRVALASLVGAAGNRYRNAPIQGGAADVTLAAYALLFDELKRFPDTYPVQSVHDSIVVECPESCAAEVAYVVKVTMEAALSSVYANVASLADAEIKTSLSDGSVVDIEPVCPPGWVSPVFVFDEPFWT